MLLMSFKKSIFWWVSKSSSFQVFSRISTR